MHKFKVNMRPTKQEFSNMKFLDRRIFMLTAEKRFSKLNKDYIMKKFREEKFPIEGNNFLGKMIFDYIKKNLLFMKQKKKIVLLDIGSAGGALTTIFALKALHPFNLIDKTEILFVDVAEAVLQSTTLGNFFLPSDFIVKYNLAKFGKNGRGIKGLLSKAERYCSDLVQLPKEIRNVDICISGFTHHHLNIFDKALACSEMERITRKGGFIGVADESLDYEKYLKWLKQHKNEKNSDNEDVPIAQESFINMEEHISMFSHVNIIKKVEKDKYYCVSMMKK